ncbi:MAG: sigma-70 family RNA polymerase sigma factor [Candidatus Acidiferrum sp.]
MDMQADNRHPEDPATQAEVARFLAGCVPLIQQWCNEAGIQRWGLSTERFTRELARCAAARFRAAAPSSSELQSYLGALHLEDLALACACADGVENAWEYFIGNHRGYLRACAAAVLKRSATSPEARELADSLFAELYGLSEGKRGSLLRYFHGRSSLRTWLRAVLAQRHVNMIRAGRKFEELGGEDGDGGIKVSIAASTSQAGDPYRQKYLQLFSAALRTALNNLEPLDAQRLKMYYAEEKKLAEIGRVLGEHESSVSRHLEKVRRDLRHAVEEILLAGSGPVDGQTKATGLSDAEIALCFEYASEDAPIDLDNLFPRRESQKEVPKAEHGGKEI